MARSGKRLSSHDQMIDRVHPMSFKVRIAQAGQTVDVPPGATILAAALDAGIAFPFGCQSGNCGACKARLVHGEVAMRAYSDFALTEEEKARGLFLACRALPRHDSEVAWLEEDDFIFHPRRRPDCRVIGIDDATHDIKRIRLEIVAGGPFVFSAGQFASVTFEGCPPRDYSMANVPGDPILEFHVRITPGGATSAHVSGRLKPGDAVCVEGPFGPSYLRESHRGPIIAVAGGSGMAPMKSVVERALQKALPQPIHFYFGVRTMRDLYLHEHFAALAEAHGNLRFVPVLSEDAPAGIRRGLVHEALADDFDTFDGCKAYLAGPPVMVEATARLFEQRGMRRMDIHADAFYTAAEMASAGRRTGAEM
jgi:naphthalene 1,2-dioxygenase ferredoxin reductase component